MKTLVLSALVGAFALAAFAGGEACSTAEKAAAPACCPATKAKLETTKASTCPAAKTEVTAAKDASCPATKPAVTKAAPAKKQSPKATTLASK